MRDGWRDLKFGEVLQEIHRPVLVADLEEVRYAGVRWYAGGVYARESVPSFAVKARSLTELRVGDVTYNRMWATKASFGVVHGDVDGCHVTNDFPIFEVNMAETTGSYIELIFQTEGFQSAAAERATGTTERRRLKQRDFESIPVILPTLEEQRRIVDLVAAVDDAIEAADEEAHTGAEALARMRQQVFGSGSDRVPAGQQFDIAIGKQRTAAKVDGDNVIPYLRSANVALGRILLDDVLAMNFSEREAERLRLQDDDVLVTEGSASEVAVGVPAVWRGELSGPVGIQNALIRVRAVPGKTTPSFAEHWAFWAYESGTFRDIANGTNIKHVGVERAKSLSAPALDEESQRLATAPLDGIRDAAAAARATADALRTLRSNLLTVLLSGEHEIPASYDELLEVP